MQNQSWAQTMERLRRWQGLTASQATVWELRRILLDSVHIRLIGFCAAKRALGRLDGESWQKWWERDLPRMPESDAMKILLDVWNKDVWAHLQWLGSQNAAYTVARLQAYPYSQQPSWSAVLGEVSSDSAFDSLALGGFNLALAEPALPGLESVQQARLRDHRAQSALSVAQLALSARERVLAFLSFPQAQRRDATPAMDALRAGNGDAPSSDAIGSGLVERSSIGVAAPAKSTGDATPRA